MDGRFAATARWKSVYAFPRRVYVRANAKGTIPIAVKRQFYNPNYNPKVEFIAKINEFLYKNAKKNTTLCVIFCIKVVFWWAEVDSNHRSRRRQIYSLIHLAALESAHIYDVALFVVEPVIGLEPTTC